jgi:lysyl-tRNA synthetase class 2
MFGHRPLGPSELDSSAGVQNLAGRLLEARGSRVLLGAAHAQCWVDLAEPVPALVPGHWLLLCGRVEDGRMIEAILVGSSPGSLRAEGERSRIERTGGALVAVDAARRWVRRYFEAQQFVEVRTPVRVAAPDPSVYIAPHATQEGWLITSPEFHMKRLLVGGLARVYQFASCTRDGEVGLWHQPEFSMLEWYRAFADMQSVMADTEAIVSGLFAEFGRESLPAGASRGGVHAPFERLTVREAFQRFADVSDAVELAETDEDRYFQIFVDRVEPALASLPHAVFVTEYPRSQAALAQPCAHDATVAERFELYVNGVELCNGYGELTDADEQLRRFEHDCQQRRQRGLVVPPIDHEFIAALVEGMPPAAGNALGFERLMALILGVPLSSVVAFPTQP